VKNNERIGYVPKNKVIEYLENRQNNNSDKDENKSNNDIKLLSKKRVLVCERCYKLKNYLNFNSKNTKNTENKNINNNINNNENKAINNEEEKINNYTLFVRKIDPNKLTKQILTRISDKSTVLYVCVN
jgi:hypothetical protein